MNDGEFITAGIQPNKYYHKNTDNVLTGIQDGGVDLSGVSILNFSGFTITVNGNVATITGSAPVTYSILTESGNTLTTESGNLLTQE